MVCVEYDGIDLPCDNMLSRCYVGETAMAQIVSDTRKTSRQTFVTRQFMAGNSPAVRIPVNMAFPNKTELVVVREGDRIIIEPKEKTLGEIPALFQKLGEYFVGDRPEFDEKERDWPR